MSDPTQTSPAPRFSIVSAVYNVEKYLDDFIASIDAQDFADDRLQVLMVDDGSTDSSPRILAEWQARRPGMVQVLTKENGGQGSARNAGIEQARGEWITFIDPDDTIAPSYLSEVDAALRKHDDTEMVATYRTVRHDATGEQHPHILSPHFDRITRVRDLSRHPDFFHGHAPSAFLRTEVLHRTGLRFDERIRPNFEDGHFCISYLLRVDRPRVAFVPRAEYLYRKRGDKSSTLGQSRKDPRRYTDVLEHGYLDVLRQAHERFGHVPDWLQTFILYELSWYFSAEDAFTNVASAAFGETAERMHTLMSRIAPLLEPRMVLSFRVSRFPYRWRQMLLHSYAGVPWHSEFALVDKLDTDQRLMRVSYRYVGERPAEAFFSEGKAAEPVHAKTRSLIYFDRTLMHERIVWLPSGTVRVNLDGVDVEVRLEEPQPPRYSLRLWHIRNQLIPRPVSEVNDRSNRPRSGLGDRLLMRASRSRVVRRFFADAWVLMDRVENADDSAELLFRYLRKDRRKVNAWFVLKKGTPDYRRLRKDRYKRLIPYGSLRWKLLMLNCHHLVSSHADAPIVSPEVITRMLTAPTWRYSFLNHGVIKDDLSTWLNPKDMDLFVTSTRGEYESVAGEGSPYRYSSRETVLTGLPRFDAVLKAGERVAPEQRDLILLAPTWRNWLVARLPVPGQTNVDWDTFASSDFAKNWLALIRSPEVERLAARHGLKVGVLLHPMLQSVSSLLDVPDHVEMLTFEGQDVRATFARARVMVTDYSSMAFNAAYIERPVVYFQFDRDLVLTGGHLGRRGYFDYERDGYGPVALNIEDALTAIVDTVEFGAEPRPEYVSRIDAAFPVRDGRCTERVYRAIATSSKRVRRKAGATAREEASEEPETITADSVEDLDEESAEAP